MKKISKRLARNKKKVYLCTANAIERALKQIALWCNGSTSDSGSACESSNLSKATSKWKFI